MVLVLADIPVGDTLLGGALDAAGEGLVDVDVADVVGVGVLVDGQGDGCVADSLAGHPAHALLPGVRFGLVCLYVGCGGGSTHQGEDGLGGGGDGFILLIQSVTYEVNGSRD